MEKQPLISICIPTYKRPFGLKAAVESVISQETFDRGDIEILIHDDCSPDNTEEVMKSLVSSVPQIRYVRNKVNLHTDANIGKMLRDFRGKYFFCITDDDKMVPSALKTMRRLIAEHPGVGVFESSYEEYFEDKGRIGVHHIFEEACTIDKGDVEKIVKVFDGFHLISRMFMKKESIDLAGYERHIGTRYPHLHTIGAAMLLGQSYYTRECLARHTIGNQTFWGYHDDYMFGGQMRIIRDLARINPDFGEAATENLVKTIPSTVRHAWRTGKGKTYKFAKSLMLIPDLRWRPMVWYNIGITILRAIK